MKKLAMEVSGNCGIRIAIFLVFSHGLVGWLSSNVWSRFSVYKLKEEN